VETFGPVVQHAVVGGLTDAERRTWLRERHEAPPVLGTEGRPKRPPLVNRREPSIA
jgi:hypothetical protein